MKKFISFFAWKHRLGITNCEFDELEIKYEKKLSKIIMSMLYEMWQIKRSGTVFKFQNLELKSIKMVEIGEREKSN